MTSFYQRYKETEINSVSVEDSPLAALKSVININAWWFEKVDKRKNELIKYLKAQLLILNDKNEFDLLKWWKDNALKYSTLARIAVDIFSISAMSVKLERVFNEYILWKVLLIRSCKLTLTDERNRLKTDIVKAVKCLRNWLKDEMIKDITQRLTE